MQRKTLDLTEALHDYVLAHSAPLGPVHRALMAETARMLPERSGMQIPPEQGLFLRLLVHLTGSSRILEVGTFTGLSALFLAEALPPGGTLVCLDVSEEWTAIARRHWAAAGVAGRIDLRIGPALDSLAALPAEPAFDLAFLDADKANYIAYYETVLPRLRPGGLVVADNVLWHGEVADPDCTGPDLGAIRAYNDHVAADRRVEVVVLPLADGVSLARKL